jgi:hypothetical protein
LTSRRPSVAYAQAFYNALVTDPAAPSRAIRLGVETTRRLYPEAAQLADLRGPS